MTDYNLINNFILNFYIFIGQSFKNVLLPDLYSVIHGLPVVLIFLKALSLFLLSLLLLFVVVVVYSI